MNKEKIKVMFVCLGNICRSPAAECILRAIEKERPLSITLVSDSSGLAGYHIGSTADSRMIQFAKKRHWNIDTRAKKYRHQYDSNEFDYVLAMDKSVYNEIVQNLTNDQDKQKVILFTDFCETHDNIGVPDPYYGGDRGFETVLDIVEDGCRGLLKHLNTQIKSDT